MKGFPSELVGDVSCGTGFAGMFATFTFLGAKAIGLKNYVIFFVEMPTALVYYFSFKWLEDQKRMYPYIPPTTEDEKASSRKNMVEKHNEA